MALDTTYSPIRLSTGSPVSATRPEYHLFEEIHPIIPRRKGEVTLHGKPLTLIGPRLRVGHTAPDFRLLKTDYRSVMMLHDFAGQILVISVVPSLDTPVCDQQAKRFNLEAASLPDTTVLVVSMDLPFAQKHWCAATEANNVLLLSDHMEGSFGREYGVLIEELRILARSVFVIGRHGHIKHVEIVPELSQHPNYDAALQAVRHIHEMERKARIAAGVVTRRTGEVTIHGNPLTLIGNRPQIGGKAAPWKLCRADMTEMTSKELKGKVVLFSIVPSLDGPKGDIQTKRFLEAAKTLDGVEVFSVSTDLPFAIKRWCTENEIPEGHLLSDYRTVRFGRDYGILIEEMRALARSVFVFDRGGILRYLEIVPDFMKEPDYDAAIAAAKSVAAEPLPSEGERVDQEEGEEENASLHLNRESNLSTANEGITGDLSPKEESPPSTKDETAASEGTSS